MKYHLRVRGVECGFDAERNRAYASEKDTQYIIYWCMHTPEGHV